jgi:hypothetical protein
MPCRRISRSTRFLLTVNFGAAEFAVHPQHAVVLHDTR